MGIKSQNQKDLKTPVLNTRAFASSKKQQVCKNGLNSMAKQIKSYSIVWQSESGEIVNDVEHGYDIEMAVERIKQSPGVHKLLFVAPFPLSKKDMDERFKLTGVKPS